MKPDPRLRFAGLISAVLGPVPMGVVLGLAVGVHSGRGVFTGAGWGLLSVACAAVIPALATAPLRKREARTPKVRLAYMTPAVAGASVGLVILLGLSAPHDVRLLAAGFAAGLICSALVNVFRASSNHVAALSGGTVLAAYLVTPWCLVAIVAVAIQGWCRVALGRHTAEEVASGTIVGAASALACVALLG